MRLNKEYLNKPNTQVFLSNAFPVGLNGELVFSITGKVVKATEGETEVLTDHGRFIVKSDVVIGARVGNAVPELPLSPEQLPKAKVKDAVAKAVSR